MTISKPMLTLIDAACEAVRQSLTTIVENDDCGNLNELNPETVDRVTKALTSSFQVAGCKAVKAYIEQFDCRDKFIVRDGRTYRRKTKAAKKEFLFAFGAIAIERNYYFDRTGGGGLVPLDEMWGMSNRYATPGVTQNILWTAGSLVASEVSDAMKRLAGIEVSTSCVQDIISRDGAAIAVMLEDEHEGIAIREIEVPEQTEVFVASMDGANVLLREPGVRSGRKSQRPGLHDGDGNEEEVRKNTSYKNAMVGSHSFYRIVEGEVETGLKGLCPERLSSVYNARMPKEKALDFKKEFEGMIGDILEKVKRREMIKIMITDAARPILKYVASRPLFEDFRFIVDYFHTSDHLSHAAEAIFGKETRDARKWFGKWCRKLKFEKDAAGGLLRSMKHYRESKHLSKNRLEELDKQITFFKRNKEYMNYPEHVANGWPIGSGPVEAACKSIVKARLCQSGMRWSTKGGRNVLALRVLAKSDQWDAVWDKYSASQRRAAA